MTPAAFIFDLDGTLIDTESLWTKAIIAWLADRGCPATEAAVGAMVYGRGWPDIDASLHAAFPSLGPADATADAATLHPYYDRLATDPASQVVPGAVAFFRKAAKAAPCVIVSGSPRADVEAAARLCGIAKLMRFALGSEDYGRGKPAPDGFLKAAAMLEVDASECVVVEDSTAGVRAGKAAGMKVIGVDRNRAARQDFSGCEWLVGDLAEFDFQAVFGAQEI